MLRKSSRVCFAGGWSDARGLYKWYITSLLKTSDLLPVWTPWKETTWDSRLLTGGFQTPAPHVLNNARNFIDPALNRAPWESSSTPGPASDDLEEGGPWQGLTVAEVKQEPGFAQVKQEPGQARLKQEPGVARARPKLEPGSVRPKLEPGGLGSPVVKRRPVVKRAPADMPLESPRALCANEV